MSAQRSADLLLRALATWRASIGATLAQAPAHDHGVQVLEHDVADGKPVGDILANEVGDRVEVERERAGGGGCGRHRCTPLPKTGQAGWIDEDVVNRRTPA